MASAAAPKIPSGMNMMLKALGIDLDPSIIPQVANAVKEIAERLARIEENQKKIATKLDGIEAKQNAARQKAEAWEQVLATQTGGNGNGRTD